MRARGVGGVENWVEAPTHERERAEGVPADADLRAPVLLSVSRTKIRTCEPFQGHHVRALQRNGPDTPVPPPGRPLADHRPGAPLAAPA